MIAQYQNEVNTFNLSKIYIFFLLKWENITLYIFDSVVLGYFDSFHISSKWYTCCIYENGSPSCNRIDKLRRFMESSGWLINLKFS